MKFSLHTFWFSFFSFVIIKTATRFFIFSSSTNDDLLLSGRATLNLIMANTGARSLQPHVTLLNCLVGISVCNVIYPDV